MGSMRLVVVGAGGRMGRALTRAVTDAAGADVAAAIEQEGSPFLGQDVGELAGVGALNVPVTDDPLSAFAKADGVLDFTAPKASIWFAELAAQARIVHVIGTTGWTPEGGNTSARRCKARTDYQIRQHEPWRQFAGEPCAQGGSGVGRRLLISKFWRCITNTRSMRPSGTALLLGEAAAEGPRKSISRLIQFEAATVLWTRERPAISVLRPFGADPS